MIIKKQIPHSKDTYNSLTENIEKIIMTVNKDFSDVIVLCIGTDRSTGDSFGPLVGTLLSEKVGIRFKNSLIPVHILGTLDSPVHASNLKQIIEEIDPKSLVIAIDASLGGLNNIGLINVSNKSINPGSGVGKDLPSVGDISITGVVNMSFGEMNFLLLQNTSLGKVYNMAKQVEHCLSMALINILLKVC